MCAVGYQTGVCVYAFNHIIQVLLVLHCGYCSVATSLLDQTALCELIGSQITQTAVALT